jgi:hypothetical protein
MADEHDSDEALMTRVPQDFENGSDGTTINIFCEEPRYLVGNRINGGQINSLAGTRAIRTTWAARRPGHRALGRVVGYLRGVPVGRAAPPS